MARLIKLPINGKFAKQKRIWYIIAVLLVVVVCYGFAHGLYDIHFENNITIQYETNNNCKISEIYNEFFEQYKNESLLSMRNIWGTRQQKLFNKVFTMISNVCKKHSKNVTFIQIGANDGDIYRSDDILQKYISSNTNWNGIMIEAAPHIFSELQQNVKKYFINSERIQLMNYGVHYENISNMIMPMFSIDTEHIISLYPQFKNKLPHWLHEIASFDYNHLERHIQYPPIFNRNNIPMEIRYSFIKAVNVSVISVESLLKYNTYTNIDLLMVDVEGLDAKIINKFISLEYFRPMLIIFENKNLNKTEYQLLSNRLEKIGYVEYSFSGNSICVLDPSKSMKSHCLK